MCFLLNNSKSTGIVRYFFDDDFFFYVVGIFGDDVFSGQSVCLKMVEFPLLSKWFDQDSPVDEECGGAGAIPKKNLVGGLEHGFYIFHINWE